MVNYQNAKIYKIISDKTNKIYIGSTCKKLCKRFSDHKNDKREKGFCSSRELIELGDAQIILIENFPCSNKEELKQRERYYIEQNKGICINKQIPMRTKKEYAQTEKMIQFKKEYRENHSEQFKQYQKKYAEKNKEILAQKAKQKVNCECGAIVSKGNLHIHRKSQKHVNLMPLDK